MTPSALQTRSTNALRGPAQDFQILCFSESLTCVVYSLSYTLTVVSGVQCHQISQWAPSTCSIISARYRFMTSSVHICLTVVTGFLMVIFCMKQLQRSSSKETLCVREVHRMVLGGLNVQIFNPYKLDFPNLCRHLHLEVEVKKEPAGSFFREVQPQLGQSTYTHRVMLPSHTRLITSILWGHARASIMSRCAGTAGPTLPISPACIAFVRQQRTNWMYETASSRTL